MPASSSHRYVCPAARRREAEQDGEGKKGERSPHGGRIERPLTRLTASAARWPSSGRISLSEGEAHGPARAGQDEDHASAGEAGQRTREQRCAADLLEGERAKQLAEARHAALEQRLDTFWCHIARSHTRATRHDQGAHACVPESARNGRRDLRRLVAHDATPRDRMSCSLQQLRHERAAGIGLERSRIAHGEHRRRHGQRGDLAVRVQALRAGPVARASSRVILDQTRLPVLSRVILDPVGAVCRDLLLPDWHPLLQRVDAKRQASKASPRCAEAATTTTAMSPIASTPVRWATATRTPGQRSAASAAIFSSSRPAISG